MAKATQHKVTSDQDTPLVEVIIREEDHQPQGFRIREPGRALLLWTIGFLTAVVSFLVGSWISNKFVTWHFGGRAEHDNPAIAQGMMREIADSNFYMAGGQLFVMLIIFMITFLTLWGMAKKPRRAELVDLPEDLVDT